MSEPSCQHLTVSMHPRLERLIVSFFFIFNSSIAPPTTDHRPPLVLRAIATALDRLLQPRRCFTVNHTQAHAWLLRHVARDDVMQRECQADSSRCGMSVSADQIRNLNRVVFVRIATTRSCARRPPASRTRSDPSSNVVSFRPSTPARSLGIVSLERKSSQVNLREGLSHALVTNDVIAVLGLDLCTHSLRVVRLPDLFPQSPSLVVRP